MSIRRTTVLAVFVSTLSAAAQSAVTCQRFSFSGRVEGDQAFQQSIGDDLAFFLLPSGAPGAGWHFEVGMPGDKSPLYVYYVTLPYRGRHPTYLDTSYGTPAQYAVMKGDRDFWFVLDGPTAKAAVYAVGQLIFSGSTQSEEQSLGQLNDACKGKGVFRIVNSTFQPGTITEDGTSIPGEYLRNGYPDKAILKTLYGRILGITFEVEMIVPSNFKVSSSLHVTRATCPGPWIAQFPEHASK